MKTLDGVRVAVIAMDGFEETELTEPVKALQEAGAEVDILSIKEGKIQAFQHHDKTIQVDVTSTLKDADPTLYTLLLLPGGAYNADAARFEPQVLEFVKSFQTSSKPIAAICHAAWILVSAGLVRGRTLTSYKTIQDDIRNAGGSWVDKEVIVDGNWITSRQPSDIPAFNREIFNLIQKYQSEQGGKGQRVA
jgi:protease I